MKRAAACLSLGLWLLAACGKTTPSVPTLLPATPTAAPSTAPPSTGPIYTRTAVPPTVVSTDTPQPTPEGLLRLTNDAARDEAPAWSWDGQQIAFSSDRTGVYEIFAMGADGSGLVQLTDDEHIEFKEEPSWSPDGRRIAFTALFDVYRIFAFDIKTAEQQPFAPSQSTGAGFPEPLSDYYKDSFSPAWSPDGRRLALTMDDFNGDHQVFSLDLSTGSFLQVTHGPSPVYMPAWSPDGRWIVFSAEIEGHQEIYKTAPDGSGLTRLTNDPAYDSRPSWSPDSQFIVFSSNRSGSYRLHLMRADGTYLMQLDTGSGEALDPAWSGDGRYIAFVSDRDGNPEIYRVNAPALEQ